MIRITISITINPTVHEIPVIHESEPQSALLCVSDPWMLLLDALPSLTPPPPPPWLRPGEASAGWLLGPRTRPHAPRRVLSRAQTAAVSSSRARPAPALHARVGPSGPPPHTSRATAASVPRSFASEPGLRLLERAACGSGIRVDFCRRQPARPTESTLPEMIKGAELNSLGPEGRERGKHGVPVRASARGRGWRCLRRRDAARLFPWVQRPERVTEPDGRP